LLENLTEKLQEAFRKLRDRGRLTEQHVEAALREIRLALLEADVNFRVVRDFIAKVRERAIGTEVLKSLTPAQQVIKIVHEELVQLLGQDGATIRFASEPPTIVMLVGLQGTGKTSTAGKLALWLRSERRKPLLVACDVYRPAAVEQLVRVGEQVNVPVFERELRLRRLKSRRAHLNMRSRTGLIQL
jgi:signal recognition particle subunit SRP54